MFAGIAVYYVGGEPWSDTRLRADYRRTLSNDPCSYCGAPFEEIEHIIPRARRGPDEWDNLTASCVACNKVKRARPLLEFLNREAFDAFDVANREEKKKIGVEVPELLALDFRQLAKHRGQITRHLVQAALETAVEEIEGAWREYEREAA